MRIKLYMVIMESRYLGMPNCLMAIYGTSMKDVISVFKRRLGTDYNPKDFFPIVAESYKPGTQIWV